MMKKILKWLLLVVLVLVVVIWVGKDAVIKNILADQLQKELGREVTIGSLRLGLWKSSLEIRDFRVMNPPGFGGGEMLAAPEIYVDYSLSSLFSGPPRFSVIRLHISNLQMVQDREGKLNIAGLSRPKSERPSRSPRREKQEPAESSGGGFRIDRLILKVDRGSFRDLADGRTEEGEIGIDEEFRDIRDTADLINIVMVAIIRNQLFARLTGLDVKSLTRGLGGEEISGWLDKATGGLNRLFKK